MASRGEAPPDLGHALDALPGRIPGECGPVDGTDRRAVDAVGNEPVLGEDLEHADLDGAPGSAPGQHQGRAGPVLVGSSAPASSIPPASSASHRARSTAARCRVNRRTSTTSTS